MQGCIQKLNNNTFKLTISGGFDKKGKRIRFYRTVRTYDDEYVKKELDKFYKECNNGKKERYCNKNEEKILQQKIFDALQKDGWLVEKEKFIINRARLDIYAKKNNETIVIECKTKPSLDNVSRALGQLLFYRQFLNDKNIKFLCSFTEKPKKEILDIFKIYGIDYYAI